MANPKILIAEDEEGLRELYKLRFELESFNVIFAKDGEETLKKIKEEKPDLVLLDIMKAVPIKKFLWLFFRFCLRIISRPKPRNWEPMLIWLKLMLWPLMLLVKLKTS